MPLRFAPKGQMHSAQGKVLKPQRKDGTLGWVQLGLQPVR